MTRFLVTYHGSEMPHEPEAMASLATRSSSGPARPEMHSPKPAIRLGSFKTIDRNGTREGPADGPFNGWSVIEANDAEAALQIL
jgi:hypothetical protein